MKYLEIFLPYLLNPYTGTGIFVIMIGYAIRFVPVLSAIANKWIPLIGIILGTIFFSVVILLTVQPDAAHPVAWRFLYGAIGFAISVLAWAVHNIAISRLEDWLAKKYPAVDEVLKSTSDAARQENQKQNEP